MPTNAPRLFLIRHGETAWSRTGQHTGLSDIPLTPDGEAAAIRLKSRLANESFARVFASPLIRARRTCELAGFGDRCALNADLVEIDYGKYDGLTGEQIREQQPDWEVYRHGGKEGESPEAATVRADRVLDLARSIEGDVAMFSSGHFIRLLAARWCGLPTIEAKHFYTSTASVGILGYEHGRRDRVVLLWNDTRA